MIVVTGIDTETTGLNQEDGHRIIELGVSVYKTADLKTFTKVGKTWLQRINPLRPIDKAAQNVHGISIEELRGCPEWKDVAPKLEKILNATNLLVAHNIGFDAPFTALELMRVGLKMPNVETFCTMLEGRHATGMGKVPSLEELCWAYDVEYDASAAHAADYDIEKTMECFFKGIKAGRFILPDSITRLVKSEFNEEVAA